MLRSETPSARVLVLTLDRPDHANAFVPELYEALADALDEAGRDPEVSVVVITGAGPVFCAGADRSLLAHDLDAAVAARATEGFRRLIVTLAVFPKPLVAAVNGAAVGVGAGILLYADVVVMAESARVRFPFTHLGLAPEAGASVLLADRVGSAAAAWLLFSSEWLEASDALACGFAWRVVSDPMLAEFVQARADAIAVHPLASLVQTKRLLNAARPAPLDELLDREHAAMVAAAGGRLD